MWFEVQKHIILHILYIVVARLCPTFLKCAVFLQSSSFWEARRALIGQLSNAFWLAEYLKLETEMLRPLPYCDAVSRRDDTKTIQFIINEAFVASSRDIITDYNDLFCLFTHRVASRHVNITMSAFVIGETTSTTVHSSKLAFESWEANS